MKRIAIALVVVFLLILSFRFLTRLPNNDPRYVPVQTQPVGPFVRENYGWGDAIPLRDGKLWLWTAASNSPARYYFYDLNQNRVIGQLLNASAVFANQDGTKLLCEGMGPARATLKQRFGALVNRLSAGKISLFSTNWIESFWILNLHDNSAIWIGEVSQFPGFGSRWVPAPGFRFGFNLPSTSVRGREFYLSDFEQCAMHRTYFAGDIQGWWNDHELVAKDSNTNYVRFDVISKKTAPLFTTLAISQFLHAQGITNYPVDYAALFNWNGNQYDLYLIASRQNGLDTNTTFLIKVRHEGQQFKLVSRSFNLHWLGHLDASGTHYLYSSETDSPGNGGNGGVYLRDLSNNNERVLVSPDNHGQYALARIYSNTVIYWRNRALWRVDVNTTNSSRLFPPPPSN